MSKKRKWHKIVNQTEIIKYTRVNIIDEKGMMSIRKYPILRRYLIKIYSNNSILDELPSNEDEKGEKIL